MMVDIDKLLQNMNQADVNVPESTYDRIRKGIESLRLQKSRKFIFLSFFQLQFKYALAVILLVFLAGTYFFSTRLPVTIIEKQGYISIASEKGEWKRLEDGEGLKKNIHLRTGKNSDILIKLGGKFTIEFKNENRMTINKMQKFFWNEQYNFTLQRCDQIYTINKRRLDLELDTPDLILHDFGTQFRIKSDEKGTYVKVYKGSVAIRRKLSNIEKIYSFKYKDEMYKKLLESMLETEAIIRKDESTFISRKQNQTLESIINKMEKQGRAIGDRDIRQIEQYIPVKRKKEEIQGVWEYDTGSAVWATPALQKGIMYFGTEKGHVFAINENGVCLWKIKAGASFLSKGLVFKNVFYIVDSKGVMFAIDVRKKRVKWKKQVGEIMYSAPVQEYGTIFIVNTSREVLALKPDTGKTIWKKKIKSGVFCEPAVFNGRMYLGCEDGSVYCINCMTSEIIWQIDTGKRFAVSSPKIYNDVLYIANNKGSMFFINIETGKIIGKEEIRSKILSSPIKNKNGLYIASALGAVYNIDIGKKVKWKLKLDEKIESSFVLAQGRLIVPTKNGKVYIIDALDSTILKIINISGRIVSSPVVYKDNVFITSLNGKVYSF